MIKLIGLVAFGCLLACSTSGAHEVEPSTSSTSCMQMEDAFVCHKNPKTKALKLCKWIDGFTEEVTTEEQVGESARKCDSPNQKCTVTFNVNHTHCSSISPEFELDQDMMTEVQLHNDPDFITKATSVMKVDCKVRPGYQAELWMKIPLKRYKGNVAYKTLIVGGQKSCGKGLVRVDSPFVTDSGQLECSFECKYKPLADTSKIVILVNTSKMKTPDEEAAVKSALNKILDNLPPISEGVAQTATVNGVQAWANGRCYNMYDPKTYRSLCGACLKYLIDNVASKVDHARGARWLTNDCFLRYEFYEVDAFSHDDDVPDSS